MGCSSRRTAFLAGSRPELGLKCIAEFGVGREGEKAFISAVQGDNQPTLHGPLFLPLPPNIAQQVVQVVLLNV